LPNGKKLLTLKDAIAWLAKEIPKSEHGMKRVQAAAHCVTEAATLRRADDVCADRHHAGIEPSPRSRVQSEAERSRTGAGAKGMNSAARHDSRIAAGAF